ncbi:ATP-binding protein [Ectobacillus sp. sgz5001026]|uniref:ATP-binding protein n=1 Tax=Ectobacillus sp. sgz5001026 TaxID=3242473 RepID=UPI0036D3B2BA
MEQVRDLLIQIACIILPLFLYEMIRLNRYYVSTPNPSRYVTSALFSIIVMLSMSYPVNLGDGIAYSFHDIPIIAVFLYYGSLGILPAIISVLYNVILSGPSGFVTDLLETIFLSSIPFVLSKQWKKYSKNKKIVISFLLASFYALIHLIVNIQSVSIHIGIPRLYALFSVAGIIMAVTMTFHVYVTEYLNDNAMVRNEMLKSEKLNIISELAASVAHEVRNPLTVVRGFLQLLEGSETNKNKEYMQLVLTELDRAEGIISDYLNLARPQIEEKIPILLSSQLNEMTSLMSSFAAMKGVFLQVKIEENLYTIGDKAKLKQAIMNIVKNGIEAIQQKQGYLKIHAYMEDNEIVIVVKDSGVGMTKEQLARLGQPYYSLKEKGTGLGLMVTFSIIQAHNGDITYKSELGNGTEAMIRLPVWKGKI